MAEETNQEKHYYAFYRSDGQGRPYLFRSQMTESEAIDADEIATGHMLAHVPRINHNVRMEHRRATIEEIKEIVRTKSGITQDITEYLNGMGDQE
jgi:hypothetical protein